MCKEHERRSNSTNILFRDRLKDPIVRIVKSRRQLFQLLSCCTWKDATADNLKLAFRPAKPERVSQLRHDSANQLTSSEIPSRVHLLSLHGWMPSIWICACVQKQTSEREDAH